MRKRGVDAVAYRKLTLALTEELITRAYRVAEARRTTPAATIRWLLEQGLDWYEGLSRDQKEAV
ncbi:MAG: hypothetical protein GEU73_05955 [Chloroflexi bacterium]|nr:hypothetical protein [Chloroflexota bacterium]